MALYVSYNKILSEIESVISSLKSGKFSPVYVLFGQEPYFQDLILDSILENVISDSERDFNQTILYGSEISAGEIVTLAERFPVFSERQLVVVKEAQNLKKTEPLENYMKNPAADTVLVLAFTGRNLDKRTSFYKQAVKSAVTFDSMPIWDSDLTVFINGYLKGRGYVIDDRAAAILAEHTGNGLRKIVLELDKLIKSLEDGRKEIRIGDVEENIGISRDFNAFELCGSIGRRDADKAFSIARFMGENPSKYPLVVTLGALFFYASKLLSIQYSFRKGGMNANAAMEKAGIYRGRSADYMPALRNYDIAGTMRMIAAIKECDYKSKGGGAGMASNGDLLVELIAKVLE
ncbi:MAG: DNA polymerase III subunit delta [Bacteroidales bacterium]|jgi:DNA polymerase-3 subunit delta|nr:DNA polymerase III subunit delta [Bacteroidales bacterium]